LLHSFFSVSKQELKKKKPQTTEAVTQGVKSYLLLFVQKLRQMLEHDPVNAELVSRLVKIAIDINESESSGLRPDLTSSDLSDIPDTAHEEYWDAVKPELGLPQTREPLPAMESSIKSLNMSTGSLVNAMTDLQPHDVTYDHTLYVVVLGPPGSGTSTFISHCLGLRYINDGPITNIVEHRGKFKGKPICFIECPSFEQLNVNPDPFLQLVQWVCGFGANSMQLAVLVFHDIDIFHPDRLRYLEEIELFKSILGKECYCHFTLVYTSRRGPIKDDDPWFNDHVTRYGALWEALTLGLAGSARLSIDSGGAWELLDIINDSSIRTPFGGIQLQKEIYGFGLPLSETTAGSNILSILQEHYNILQETLKRTRDDHTDNRRHEEVLTPEELRRQQSHIDKLLNYNIPSLSRPEATALSQRSTSKIDDHSPTRPLRLAAPLSSPRLMVLPDEPKTSYSSVGRQLEMASLSEMLTHNTNSIQLVVICGPPGIGKTHLAKKYMWLHMTEYEGGIFWVDCTSETAATKCLDNISRRIKAWDSSMDVHEPDADVTLSRWLGKHRKWLIICDHLPSGITYPAVLRNVTIQSGGEGHIILTARDREDISETFTLSGEVMVSNLSEAACVDLIFARIDVPITTFQEEGAKRLYDETHGYPLLLHHIISSMQNQGVGLETPRFAPFIADQCTPLYHILTQDQNLGMASVFFLRILSFWAAEIPRSLFINADTDTPIGRFNKSDIHLAFTALQRGGLLEVRRRPLLHELFRFNKGIQLIVYNATKTLDDSQEDASWIDLSTLILCQAFQAAKSRPFFPLDEVRLWGHWGEHARTIRAPYQTYEPRSWIKGLPILDRCIRANDPTLSQREIRLLSHSYKLQGTDETKSGSNPSTGAFDMLPQPSFDWSLSTSPDKTYHRGRRTSGALGNETMSSGLARLGSLAGRPANVPAFPEDPIYQETEGQDGGDEGTSSRPTQRSNILKAIFKGTRIGSAMPAVGLSRAVAQAGVPGPRSSTSARSSSRSSDRSPQLNSLNRSVSGTVAHGVILRRDSHPDASSSTSDAYASLSLLHTQESQTKREGKRPTRDPRS